MNSKIPLSSASRRAFDSPISDLMAMALHRPDVISLAAGFVDHATLPTSTLARSVAAMLGDEIEAKRSLQYGTTKGDLKLRHRLVERLVAEGDVHQAAADSVQNRIIITTGSQQVLYLVSEALVEPGDIVLVESPTYFVYLGVLRRFGARVVGIPTDQGGLQIDALEATLVELERQGQLERVKLIYTIPEHSNPTGLSLAPERRPRLVELARRYSRRQRLIVLEDAAYHGLTYEGRQSQSIWSHDAAGTHVVHARTFSKTFSPGIKIGYGIFPEELVGPILNLKESQDFGTSHFVQQAIEGVLRTEAYDAHLARLRGAYRRKRDAMLSALDEHMKPLEGAVTWTHPGGGLYVWLTVPEGLDMGPDGPIFPRCLQEGVLYVPGALAFAKEPVAPPPNHARLSFGVAGLEGIEEGIRRLSVALSECLDPVA